MFRMTHGYHSKASVTSSGPWSKPSEEFRILMSDIPELLSLIPELSFSALLSAFEELSLAVWMPLPFFMSLPRDGLSIFLVLFL